MLNGKPLMRLWRIITRKNPNSLEECSRKELIRRIQEVMTRIWGNMPNDILEWDFDRYRVWLSEPFCASEYEEYDDSEQV